MMSFSLQSCLHHWSHSWICIWRSAAPCSRQIATLILIWNDFTWVRVTWNNSGVKYLPAEQLALRGKTSHQLFLRTGLSIRVTSQGFSPAFTGITLTHDYIHSKSFHGEIFSKNIARTTRSQLDGQHLLFGVYLQTWADLYLLNFPKKMHFWCELNIDRGKHF